jgi:hypothetical protein
MKFQGKRGLAMLLAPAAAALVIAAIFWWSCRSASDAGIQAQAAGMMRKFGDGLRTRTDVQFFADAVDARVDRRHADAQQFGVLLVEMAERRVHQ